MPKDPTKALLREKERYDRDYAKAEELKAVARARLKEAVEGSEVSRTAISELFGWSRQSIYDLLGEK